MDTRDTWDRFLQAARTELGDAACDLWFSGMRLTALKDGQATVEVPNHYVKEWVQDNYPGLITRLMGDASGTPVEVKLHISAKEDKELRRSDEKIERRQQTLARKGIFLNPKYTFANFVEGESNKLARGAAEKVAEAPGRAYNPLFIYGGVGLGKTHLITAIGNKILTKHPSFRVHYVPVEQFTNEVVSAIRHARTEELKDKYRNLDVLLIDDVQLLEGKQATENELFHTFNVLYESQKQVVISSDRPPVEITSITDRLRSRFGMGLIVDIQPPEIETKLAIIRRRVEADRLRIPDEVAYYMASRIKSNVRDLEGCIIRLGAYSSISGHAIDLNVAKTVLKDIIRDEDRPLTVEGVLKEVAEFYGVKVADVNTKRRTRDIALPRQVAMYLARELTEASLGEIGKAIGGKDHATVIYACKQMEKRRTEDEAFGRMIEKLKGKIAP